MGLLGKLFGKNKDKHAEPVPHVSPIDPAEEAAHSVERLKKEYKLIKLLGEGAQGQVDLYEHVATKKRYAVKSIRRKGEGKPKELTIIEHLLHPNLVELLDWFVDKKNFYLVFELATGGELLDRLVAKGAYSEHDACNVAATLFATLAYVHAHDIAHRDLKTANLIFKDDRPNSELMLVDFGVAKSTTDAGLDHSHNAPASKEVKQNLMTTFAVGTPYYQAPEIVAHTPYLGKAADIYALGAITYTLLSGMNPFWEAPPYDLEKAVKANKWSFNERRFARISPEGKDFITKCLQTEPLKRLTAVEALDHPWMLKFTDKAYRDWLLAVNDDILEFERQGMEKERREFVESIKEHATVGEIVPDEELPHRPSHKEEEDGGVSAAAAAAGPIMAADALDADKPAMEPAALAARSMATITLSKGMVKRMLAKRQGVAEGNNLEPEVMEDLQKKMASVDVSGK